MTGACFCIARVGEPIDSPDGLEVEFVNTELPNAIAVIDFLKATFSRFATMVADENADRSFETRIDTSKIGGFGVQLTNRFGSQVEVAWGRQFCLMIRTEPRPSRIFSSPHGHRGTLVFYLDGWHHTEMDKSDLATCDDCLTCLNGWLESNVFPTPDER